MLIKYYATKLAGRKISGMRNPGYGNPIELTEAQAAQPLRQGHITVDKPAAAKSTVKSGAKKGR